MPEKDRDSKMSDKFLKAFFIAVRKGDTVAVRRAIAEGADPNAKDENDLTPLFWLARKGHFNLFTELLKAGADVNYRDAMNQTFLHHCVLFKKHDFLKEALTLSNVPLDGHDCKGFTALDIAIADCNQPAADLLKAAGANPNIYTKGHI
jgi:ankyrin repeat protein